VEVLGTTKKCTWKRKEKTLEIDLSNLRPGDISATGIFVLKLSE
jgi:hypothetical protein